MILVAKIERRRPSERLRGTNPAESGQPSVYRSLETAVFEISLVFLDYALSRIRHLSRQKSDEFRLAIVEVQALGRCIVGRENLDRNSARRSPVDTGTGTFQLPILSDDTEFQLEMLSRVILYFVIQDLRITRIFRTEQAFPLRSNHERRLLTKTEVAS